MKLSIKNILLTTSVMTVAIAGNAVAAPALDPTGNSNGNLVVNGALVDKVNGAGLTLNDFKTMVSNNNVSVFSNANVTGKANLPDPSTQDHTTTLFNQTSPSARIKMNDMSTNPNDKIIVSSTRNGDLTIFDVTSGKVSYLQGSLQANDHVVIKNDAGVIFGAGSQTNVGALGVTTAKTMTLNADGTYAFTDISGAPIQFNGNVTAANGGYIIATAKEIDVGSTGSLNVNNGNVILAAGSKAYTVDLSGSGKVLYSVANLDSGTVNVLGNIDANSSDVVIRAKANDVASGTINLAGMIDTSSFATPNADPNILGFATANKAGDVTVSGTGAVAMTGKINANGAYVSKANGSLLAVAAGDVSIAGKGVTISRAGASPIDSNIIGNSVTIASTGDATITNSTIGSQTGLTVTATGAAKIDGGYYDADAMTVTGKTGASLNGNFDNNSMKVASSAGATDVSGEIQGNGAVDISGTSVTIGSKGHLYASTLGNVTLTSTAGDTTINNSSIGTLKAFKNTSSGTTQITGSTIFANGDLTSTATGGGFRVTDSTLNSNGDVTTKSNGGSTVYTNSMVAAGGVASSTTAGTVVLANSQYGGTAGTTLSGSGIDISGSEIGTATGATLVNASGAGSGTLSTLNTNISGKTVTVDSNIGLADLENTNLEARDTISVTGKGITIDNDASHHVALIAPAAGITVPVVVRSIKIASTGAETLDGNIETKNAGSAASVTLSSVGAQVVDSSIDTSGSGRAAGDVTITSSDSSQVLGGINTSSTGAGGDVKITAAKSLTVNNVINSSGTTGGAQTITAKGAYTNGDNAKYISKGTKTGGAVTIAGGVGSNFGGFDPVTGASLIFQDIDASGGTKNGVVKVTGPNGVLKPAGQL